MSTPWWRGLPPAAAQVSCDGRKHVLRWAAGELRAPSHPDLENERILSALTGQRFACLDALDAWSARADDLRVLVLASRGPADPVAVQPHEPGHAGWRAGRPATMQRRPAAVTAVLGGGGPASGEPQDTLAPLLSLDGPMQARLTATVAAAWRERLCDWAAPRTRRPRPGRRCTRRWTAGWWLPCGPGPDGPTSGSR